MSRGATTSQSAVQEVGEIGPGGLLAALAELNAPQSGARSPPGPTLRAPEQVVTIRSLSDVGAVLDALQNSRLSRVELSFPPDSPPAICDFVLRLPRSLARSVQAYNDLVGRLTDDLTRERYGLGRAPFPVALTLAVAPSLTDGVGVIKTCRCDLSEVTSSDVEAAAQRLVRILEHCHDCIENPPFVVLVAPGDSHVAEALSRAVSDFLLSADASIPEVACQTDGYAGALVDRLTIVRGNDTVPGLRLLPPRLRRRTEEDGPQG